MSSYFVPIRNIYNHPEVYDDVIITNSATLKVGGLVKLASGFASAVTAGDAIYGVAVGFVGTTDQNVGLPLDKLTSGVDYDGSYTAGGPGTGTYVAASDNQTDKKIAVRVRIDQGMVMTNTPDATIGTTSGSNLKGGYTDVADYLTVDENNNSAAFTTKAQLFILGVGGGHNYENISSSVGLYMIAEKQELGG